MTIVCVGIDLAKSVFALHGVSEDGAVGLRQPKVARAKLNALVATLPPVRDRHRGVLGRALLGAPVPGEAVQRPNMRFVPVRVNPGAAGPGGLPLALRLSEGLPSAFAAESHYFGVICDINA